LEVELEQGALISNSDFRAAVGELYWPELEETRKNTDKAFAEIGVQTYRAHLYYREKKHNFITTQSECCGK
jgi:hypothetical protein